MNAGSFKKGEKRPNQGKRGAGKATLLAREAIARLVDDNAHRLEGWLDAIAKDKKQGPMVAWRCMMDVLEYHIPKLARTEHAGDPNAPVKLDATVRFIKPPQRGD